MKCTYECRRNSIYRKYDKTNGVKGERNITENKFEK